jgi:hypothetical protein
MTIPGVDATVALSIVAAVGDFARFHSPKKLVSYLGLNPAGPPIRRPACVTRADHQAGRAHARGMLVEAAWAASKTPGPLRAFYQRVRARRGMQVAVVATACKLSVLCWHLITKGEDYAFARPSLTAHKLRRLELRAGMPSKRGQKGNAAGYSLKEVRRRENELNEQAEQAYRQLVADWHTKAPKRESGVAATNEARLSRPSNGATAARQDSAPDPALRSGAPTPTAQPNGTAADRRAQPAATAGEPLHAENRPRFGSTLPNQGHRSRYAAPPSNLPDRLHPRQPTRHGRPSP